VGAGAIASLIHLPTWKKILAAKVVGIFDVNEKASKKFANRYKIPKIYPSLDGLLGDSEVDLVDVCTPIHTHFPIIEAALLSNKHVITEKPLSSRSMDAKRLVQLAENKNKVLGVSQNHLYSKAVRALKNKIDNGRIGIPLLYTLTFPFSIYKKDHWTANPKTGGLLFELGIHPAYIAAFLFGKPDKVHTFGNNPSPNLKPGWAIIILEKNKKLFDIVLTPVQDQPIITVHGSKGYAFANLFADFVYWNKTTTILEWGKTSMHSMTSTGLKAAKNWINLSGKIAVSYAKRGFKYWLWKHQALNQFVFFNEILSAINSNNKLIKEKNKLYLEKAIQSIEILEQVKVALNN
jgi:predicted dehydrogenase